MSRSHRPRNENWHVKPLLHPIVHARTSWLQRKNRLICMGPSKYTCDFMTEYGGRTDTAMKIGMHIILCVHAVCQQMHPCLKGNLRET